jgi:serine/threonine protein kinase
VSQHVSAIGKYAATPSAGANAPATPRVDNHIRYFSKLWERSTERLKWTFHGTALSPSVIDMPDLNLSASFSALSPKYTVEKKLGHGTQGQMFLVHNAQGDRFAVKAYNLQTIPNWKANDLMMREIEVLQTLYVDRVPHCVDVIDASSLPDPYIFVVQAYVDGQSLMDMIVNGHRFTLQEIINITKDIASILDDIEHTAKIIHRDIKPSNIMIDADRRAWLVDFGSVVRSVKHEGGSTIAGTAGYMAPEQCLGDAVPVSDIYGLGMSIIHLLTGMAPFEFEQEKLRPVYRPHLPKKVPAWFIELLDQMIDPFAAKRINAAGVLQCLAKGDPDDVSWYVVENKRANEAAQMQMRNSKHTLKAKFHPEIVFLVTSQLSFILITLCYIPGRAGYIAILAYAIFVISIYFSNGMFEKRKSFWD